jgi:pimeloyl-ACP methyl ester carboxylesterase
MRARTITRRMAVEISDARYRAGEGEPLVLVHGFTATWRCWQPVLDQLSARFEVIAPTLHGHDGGPPPPSGGPAHTTAEAADHLELLLDELGVGTAHLAGNSMGGALALELAKRGRARSVVAISPGGGWDPDDRREAARIARYFLRNQRLARVLAGQTATIVARPRSRRTALRDVMARGDRVPPAEALQLISSSTRCDTVPDVLAALRAGKAHISGLEQIDCPVLIAWGERDRILPVSKHSARFRDEIPGAEFRPLPGLGHTPMWDDPSVVAELIAGFASAHGTKAGLLA